jgi:hypothetical protein
MYDRNTCDEKRILTPCFIRSSLKVGVFSAVGIVEPLLEAFDGF